MYDKEKLDPALLTSLWQSIREQLAADMQRIVEEIRSYPPPIPACDAQFNYLLEERARVFQELGRVDALRQASQSTGDPVGVLDEFVLSSAFVQPELAQTIRSALANGSGASAESAGELVAPPA